MKVFTMTAMMLVLSTVSVLAQRGRVGPGEFTTGDGGGFGGFLLFIVGVIVFAYIKSKVDKSNEGQ